MIIIRSKPLHRLLDSRLKISKLEVRYEGAQLCIRCSLFILPVSFGRVEPNIALEVHSFGDALHHILDGNLRFRSVGEQMVIMTEITISR